MLRPTRQTPGARLPNGWYNRLLDYVESLRPRFSNDFDVRVGAEGAPIVTLARRHEWEWPARVVAVNGTSPGAPGTITYDVETYDKKISLTGLTPLYGRPVIGTVGALVAAQVGDYCKLVRQRNDAGDLVVYLWILSESIAPVNCAAAVNRADVGVVVEE